MLTQIEIHTLIYNLFKDEFFLDKIQPIQLVLKQNNLYFVNTLNPKESLYSYISLYNGTNLKIGVHHDIIEKITNKDSHLHVMTLEIFQESKHEICQEIKKTEKYNTFFFEKNLSSIDSSYIIL